MKQNYYGSLVTKMYEILHKETPKDELNFYLSYAKKEMKILEVMCGSGRFLISFKQLGYNIMGIDSSKEMLNKLKEKDKNAHYKCIDILKFYSKDFFDYIFITSGSVSLFTDLNQCKEMLTKIQNLLSKKGLFVFAVDSIACKEKDDDDFKINVSVETDEGYELILKTKNHFDVKTQTQYSPGIYELYNQNKLLKKEKMN